MNSDDRYHDPSAPTNAELVNRDSFEKLRSKNRRREIGRRVFYFFIALLLIASVAAVCIALFFGLKQTEVQGNLRYSEEEILSVCGFTADTNLFAIDFEKTERALLEAFPYLRDVSFRRVLPSTLVIRVTEDAPRYCAEIHGDWFLLAHDLRVISRHDLYEEIEVLSLPLIYLYLPEVDYAVAGEHVRFSQASSYKYMTSFLDELTAHDFFKTVQCIDASDRYHIDLYASNGRFLVKIGNTESLDTKLRFVTKVLEDPTFTQTTIASINVEYVKQVIVLKQDKPFSYR